MITAGADPWSLPDYPARVALALSILGHADERHWAKARDRAVLALLGATLDEVRELTEAE